MSKIASVMHVQFNGDPDPTASHLSKFALIISMPASAPDILQSPTAVLQTNSWTISFRHESMVKSLPPVFRPFAAAIASASFGIETDTGRHQTTVLSPMTKLRCSSRARFSGEPVDNRMMRKFLCGTGSGRLCWFFGPGRSTTHTNRDFNEVVQGTLILNGFSSTKSVNRS